MNVKLRGLGVSVAAVLLASAAVAAGPPGAPLKKCPVDAVVSGTVCMDKYEASVWRVPSLSPGGTSNAKLVKKIQAGTATVALLSAGGATQLGAAGNDYAPCNVNGQNCANDIYAVSLPAVVPARYASWFQAQQACKNSRKRLPSNAEWQAAVAGTPDPGTDNGSTECNTNSTSAIANTGSRTACVSFDGAYDMVGNLLEWVADWMSRSTGCWSWSAGVSPTGDSQCLGGADTVSEPGALVRGGDYVSGTSAGPFTVFGNVEPSSGLYNLGFRCAR